MTVATRELLTVTKTAWGVWYSEWLVLNLSSKSSLSLYHIPKYLSLLTDVILSPHSSRCPFSPYTHKSWFPVQYSVRFCLCLLSDSCSPLTQQVLPFTQRSDSSWRGRPGLQTCSHSSSLCGGACFVMGEHLPQVSDGRKYRNYFLLLSLSLPNRNKSLSFICY